MSVLLWAFVIGIVAGLRVFTAPAAVSWAARLGWLHLAETPLAFLGAAVTPWIFTLLALFELYNDQRPGTGSRKAPPSFIRGSSAARSAAPPSARRQALSPAASSPG